MKKKTDYIWVVVILYAIFTLWYYGFMIESSANFCRKKCIDNEMPKDCFNRCVDNISAGMLSPSQQKQVKDSFP